MPHIALEFIDNALDEIKNGGLIRVVLRRRQSSKNLILSVGNDGPGISPDLANRVFEEGISTKGSGRGMGLHILKRLADRLNGQVSLKQDDGVEFSIVVPLS